MRRTKAMKLRDRFLLPSKPFNLLVGECKPGPTGKIRWRCLRPALSAHTAQALVTACAEAHEAAGIRAYR
jgi:hypothetical protein